MHKIRTRNTVYRILHITPHLGGGVGRVLLNYLEKVKDSPNFVHAVACLEYANENAKETARKIHLRISDNLSCNWSDLNDLISAADIVLIHWWNHPLLFDLIVRHSLPPSRVIIWSHISGFHPPYVFSKKILGYPDVFVFTTPVSQETDEVKMCPDEQKWRFRVVWSTGGVDHVRLVRPRPHQGFIIGYIGTVDYAKLHPDYLSICNEIDIH